MPPQTQQVRRTLLALLTCIAVATSSGCTGQASELETAQQACDEFSAIVEPYAVPSSPDPSKLSRPTNPPTQWREDARAMKEVAQPLLEFEDKQFDRSRLPEFGQRMVMLADYLNETSRDPDEYDTGAAAGLVYPAESICSDAIEEAA